MASFLTVALALGVSGCSSSDEAAAPDGRAGEIRGADLWKDGLQLTGIVTIAEGAVVDIEPGAKITCAEGAALYVSGTLRAKAAANHARISCAEWMGVVVNPKGALDLEGLELENGSAGLTLLEQSAPSRFAEGAILNALHPIQTAKGTKLDVANIKITTPKKVPDRQVSISEIYGTMTATRVDYDAASNEGISVKETGDLTISDSTLHGTNAFDLISAYKAAHLKVSYTMLTGAHCGLHIEPAESFEIDHVTSDANIFGITIYGSGNGPNTVTDSNFTGTSAWLDFQGDNGPVTFDGVYTNGREVMLGGPVPTITNTAKTPNGDAKPR
ncbi:hypothetical protein AKJ09_08590 [Labilithrix luteola]|uniref:Uncharacterized protein n=1 Tax=Labilithrix luteola TaxID=1391654 RepID=A0A0K1Q8E2_9BACT|nr:right-handed parallel beta-helix repeat-containing protein [Labilithrix luteola]AKV01927.1 hypothetical protein AKJ09_08590 [Labilithrix luteola]